MGFLSEDLNLRSKTPDAAFLTQVIFANILLKTFIYFSDRDYYFLDEF